MQKSRKLNIIKCVSLVIVCVVVLLITSNGIVNSIAYNPYDNSVNTNSFIILTQLLSPSVSYSWLSPNKPQMLLRYGVYTQQFFLDQFPERGSTEETVGTFGYQCGNISIKSYDDKLGFGTLTCHQSVFINNSAWQGFSSISYDKNYEVWFEFINPMNGSDFVKNYGWVLNNNLSRPQGSGLIWIPIKTSNNASDVCLGMLGNLSTHYLNNPVFGLPDYYDMDIYERENIFRQALNYLIIHPKETKMFLNSGLYADSNNLNFDQRLSYIQENGIQFLGMVAYLRGDVLMSFKADNNLRVVKITER